MSQEFLEDGYDIEPFSDNKSTKPMSVEPSFDKPAKPTFVEPYAETPKFKYKPDFWTRTTDRVAKGFEHLKYKADQNKFTRWLFDTRDVALPPSDPNWSVDMFNPKNFSSKLPDSVLENVTEFVPNIYTSIFTNADDFVKSESPEGAGLEAAAAASPFLKYNPLRAAGLIDYAVDSYQDNTAGLNSDIKREEGADPYTPWGVYETEQLKAKTKPVPKPKPLRYD